MLCKAQHIYSGGLWARWLAIQLKTTSDLSVPVIGVRLLCQQDYFRQALYNDGAQQALFPYNFPGH